MKKDTVVELKKPEVIAEDPLMEVLRRGAREMLKCALEAEVEEFLARFDEIRDSSGKRLVIRNGYKRENDSNRNRRHSGDGSQGGRPEKGRVEDSILIKHSSAVLETD